MPGEQLKNLGHEVSISPFPQDADIYVFTKHFNYGDYWYLSGIMSENKKGVFHCCDYHFDTKHRNHYRKMIEKSNTVITSTPELASIIKMETGREPVVIPDMYEFEEKKPAFNLNGKVKILWYGHFSNLDSLSDIKDELKDYDLRICTIPNAVPREFSEIPVIPYSLYNLAHAFDWCDVVIIPSRSDTRKLVKSHNRLTEAVRQGKFVIASALPSYREFEDSMYIGNIPEGLVWIQDQKKEDVESRISKAQEHIRGNYNPDKIGRLWEKALVA